MQPAELIASAREQDVLNAVFALQLYNARDAWRSPEQGKIDVHRALDDAFPPGEIDDALARSDTLIGDAKDVAFGEWHADQHLRELAARHPGFTAEHVRDALSWGYYNAR
ncbi:hypothetical protein [Georgenia sp. SUBG003]|uniref:hypothetical protein n=1 Tax=Georgenia sp. SUBG003 TaxID=1497974 RepID=UPI0004D497E6|nr:hypothetical protein DA06_16635 [Georgenia sp. SUBG003]